MRDVDVPILLASKHAAPASAEPFPLDRVRMQKAAFLLVQRGPEQWRSLLPFRPYNWGPYSSALTQALDKSISSGDLQVEQVSGSKYGRYVTTVQGEASMTSTWEGLPSNEREFIRAVRKYVTSRSFAKLLRDVYAQFPDYATASQFSG